MQQERITGVSFSPAFLRLVEELVMRKVKKMDGETEGEVEYFEEVLETQQEILEILEDIHEAASCLPDILAVLKEIRDQGKQLSGSEGTYTKRDRVRVR